MKVRAPLAHTDPGSERETRLYYYWLLLSLFLEYARPASFLPLLQVPLLYSAIPLGLVLASSFARGLRPLSEVFSDRLAKWIVIYISLIALSVTYAIVTEFAFDTFKLALGYVFLCLLLARIVTTEGRLLGVVATLIVAHLFLLAMNPKVITEPETRTYIMGATFLGDGNDFSLSLCILLPCAIRLASRVRSMLLRLVCWAAVLLILFAMVASQSRGATLGLAAVLAFVWLKSRRKLVSLIGILIAGIAVLLYAPDEYFNRMNSMSDYENEGSAMGRIHAWQAGTKMAMANPLLGIGAGNFPVAYGTRYRPANAPNEWKTAHSSYFLVMGELGFTGLFILLVLVFGNIRQNERLRSAILKRAGPTPDEVSVMHAGQLYLLTAAMIGFASAGAFLSAAYYPHVFVLSGLLIAARCMAIHATGIDPAVVNGPQKGKRPVRRRGVAVSQPEGAAPPASVDGRLGNGLRRDAVQRNR